MTDVSRIARLAVALDTDDRSRFSELCQLFGPRVEVLKVGLEAYTLWGPAVVEEAKATGARVFLDLKLHDIPNTVAGAVRAALTHGVDFLTVHAGGGAAMLEAAATAADDRLKILAVTVLTSLDQAQLEGLGMPGTSGERASSWANLAHGAGCHGVVCSALEAAALRARHSEPFYLVTPGIRLPGGASDDQARVATPELALGAGSSLLVVGRPLTRASDALGALDQWARAIGTA